MHHSSPAVTMGLRTTKLVQWFWRHGACWSQIISFCFINFHLFVDLACHATKLLSLQRFYVLGEARSLSTYGIRAEVLLHGQARTHSYGAPSGRPSLFLWMSSLPSVRTSKWVPLQGHSSQQAGFLKPNPIQKTSILSSKSFRFSKVFAI